jgi:DpnII restriction endonuclease
MKILLATTFNDVRAEEYVPTYGGAGSRIDFLLKPEQIVLEVKKTRVGLSDRQVGEQLIIDAARYSGHPDCRILVCMVYDPENRITNPAALEADLSGNKNGIAVEVIIVPKLY